MRCYVRATYFYNICVDLVMCTWYKPEAIAVLVVLVILLALFGPGTPPIAVGLLPTRITGASETSLTWNSMVIFASWGLATSSSVAVTVR